MGKKLWKRKPVKIFFVFFLVFSWLFAGWLPIWQNLRIPPEIQEVQALNKVNNWDFNGSSTGWTISNNGSGTDLCGLTTSASGETAFTTFAYNGNLSGQTAFGATTSDPSKNVTYRGTIYQAITAPGSGTVKAKGRFSWYAVGTNWRSADTSWLRIDLYDSGNSNFVANLACVSFNADQSWTTVNFGSDVDLTGGISYTLRVTFRAYGGASKSGYITIGVDNIIVDFAPTGLSASAPAGTKNAQLDWTASTAGSGAPGLHGTTPYKVYRDESSPVFTFLGNSTTNTYTDSSTTGNTSYYYAVSDIDTNSVESPLSAESSILTLPDVPGTPTFTSVTSTSLDVNWTSPTGGAVSYKVEQAPDSGGSPGSWEEKTTGVTSPWTDSTVSCGSTYWYRVRGTNATGDGSYSDNASITPSCGVSISITTNGSVSFGTLGLGVTANTTPGGVNDVEIVRVDSGPANLEARSTNFTEGGNTWILDTANGSNKVKWEFSKDGTAWTTFAVADTLYPLDTNVGVGETRNIYLQITMPTFSDSYNPYSSTVTIVASAP